VSTQPLGKYLTDSITEWSGINALLYYGPSLMAAVGLHDETMLVMAGLINVIQLIAVVPAIMYLDDWGRKPLLKCESTNVSSGRFLTFV